MSRAEPARSNNTDDIPLAERTSPFRRLNKAEVRLISLSLMIFGTVALVLSLSLSPPRGSNPMIGVKSPPSPDGRLLGHYPYSEASRGDLVSIYPGLEIHTDTYKALKLMSAAAAADGINLVFLSGYRSIDLQRQIFYGRKSTRNQIAIQRAKVSAPPGYSEHSTGYAIDLGDSTMRETDFEEDFELTPAFQWLRKNAARYHFVLSFPKGNPQKVSYEPWHWRYEGTVEALKQFEPANQKQRIGGS